MVFIERHAITLLDDCLYAKPMSQTMQYPLFLVYSKFICLDIRYCILNETPSHHKWVHGVRMCLLKCGDGYFSLASTQQANCFLSDQSRRQIFPAFWFAIYSMRTRAFYFNKLIVKYIKIFLLFMIDTNSARGIYPVLNFPKLHWCWTRSFPHRAFYILHSHPLYIRHAISHKQIVYYYI